MKAITLTPILVLALGLAACTAKIEGGNGTPPPPPPEKVKRTESPAVQALKLSKGDEQILNYVDAYDTKPETTRAFTFKPEQDGKLTLTWMGNEYSGNCNLKAAKEELEVQVMNDGKVANGYRIGFNEAFPMTKGLEYRVQFKLVNLSTCGYYSLAFTAKYQ